MADKITFKHTSGTTTKTVATYTDNKIDSLLALKGDKSVVDTKANKVDVYTKSEVDSALAKKQGTGSYAHLGNDGKVPSSELPSYVDDVLEGYLHNGIFYKTKADNGTYSDQVNGESGKIYVDLPSGRTYRYGGTAYAEISSSLALGETSSTAYAGDKGKKNADDIKTLQGYFYTNAADGLVWARRASDANNAICAMELIDEGYGNYFTYQNIVDRFETLEGYFISGKANSASKADSATKATNDGNGNNIVNTYATKATVSTKADKSTWSEANGVVTITLG